MRSSILTEVCARTPADARERWASRCVLDAVAGGAERGDTAHVTASAVVVSDLGVLLHVHKRLRRWTLPGGHVDPGEHPAETARRETVEETGVEASHPEAGPMLIHLDVYQAARGHTHMELRYLLEAPPLDPRPPPDESQRVAWFARETAPWVVDAGVANALRSALTRHRLIAGPPRGRTG